MKIVTLLVCALLLAACAAEKVESASPPASAAPPPAPTSSEPAPTTAEAADVTPGTWAGQLKIDAHAGTATLNYVGAESGDFVPLRFRTDSEAAAKIFAECADEDLCEVEGTIRLLDEPPPGDASAVGEIVSVDRVKKLPPAAP